MIISIMASTSQGAIGNRGTLPWPRHKEDMAWFKEHTEGHIVVMGRRTWDDPAMPKPLPNRINYVVSHSHLEPQHQHLARWLLGDPATNVRRLQKENPDKHVFIIGGKTLYEACLPATERVLLTRMKGNWFADTRIDINNIQNNFRIKSVKPGDNCTFEIWDRLFWI